MLGTIGVVERYNWRFELVSPIYEDSEGLVGPEVQAMTEPGGQPPLILVLTLCSSRTRAAENSF